MHHGIHDHQVHHRICVGRHAEVLVIVSGEGHLQAVVVVHHGGDAIKPEAVKLELVEPVAGVGEKEPEGLPLAVVETAGVPHPADAQCAWFLCWFQTCIGTWVASRRAHGFLSSISKRLADRIPSHRFLPFDFKLSW
jgi:hypothetical protein